EGKGKWLALDSELVINNGEVVGTRVPTEHRILIDARFELPNGERMRRGTRADHASGPLTPPPPSLPPPTSSSPSTILLHTSPANTGTTTSYGFRRMNYISDKRLLDLPESEAAELQDKLSVINSMMNQDMLAVQDTQRPPSYAQSGMSEDSDYTSDINYPVQHQHNTSAHQYRGVHPHAAGSGPDGSREDDDREGDSYHNSSYPMRSADSRDTLRYDDSFDGHPLDGHRHDSREFEDDDPHSPHRHRHHQHHRSSSFDPVDPLDQLGPRSPDRGSYEEDYYYHDEYDDEDDFDGRGSSRGVPHNLHQRRGYDGDQYDDDYMDDEEMVLSYDRHEHQPQHPHRRLHADDDMNSNEEHHQRRRPHHRGNGSSGPYHHTGRSDTDSEILSYNSRPSSRPQSFIQDSPVLSHHSSINISRQSTQDYSPANSHVSSSNVSRQSTTHESSFDTFEKSDSSAHPMSSPARSRWLEAFNRVCAELSEVRMGFLMIKTRKLSLAL
ncbi:protein unc-13 homolog b-like isoform x12, partial [Plakobranchus ocellatus]